MRRMILVAVITPALGLAQPADASRGDADSKAPEALPVIQQLIDAARPGDEVRVPAGRYPEHIRIDKPLTLIAEPGAVIDGGGSGDIVEVAAPDVTLRGFIIQNTGEDLDRENAAIRVLAPRAAILDNTLRNVLFGIDLREAPDSVIRGNAIGGKNLDIARRGDGLRLWRADRTLIEANTLHDGRDAILWYSTGVTVRDNIAERCRYGLHLMYSDSVVIEDNRVTDCSVGVYLMYSKGVEIRRNRFVNNRGPSGYAIGLKETDLYRVEHNFLAGNRVGIYLDGSPFTRAQPGIFKFNTLACNDVGVTFLPSVRGNRFTSNNFIDNIEQVSVLGRGPLRDNEFWHEDSGNYWSDYLGYDEDHDGIGDFVHESQTLFENLMDRRPELRLFLFSPAQQAVEFVGRAVPAVRPEPKFIDEVPLMRPVATHTAHDAHPASAPAMAGIGALLLSIAASVLAWARAGGAA